MSAIEVEPQTNLASGHGFAVRWHDFVADGEIDWAKQLRPQTLEICLNVSGRAEITNGSNHLMLAPQTAGFYQQHARRLKARRAARERHQFYTVAFSFDFLAHHLGGETDGLHPAAKTIIQALPGASVSEPLTLTWEQQVIADSLRRPPVPMPARPMWYKAKALELAAGLLYTVAPTDEFFCQRYKRQARERTQRVIALLCENLATPPPLEEIGRQVGCSHYYLSRIFSQEMGCGIFQYLRRLRLLRAAELLREGRMNVTEVALAVGYATPSHFSTAFHEHFGCCPGLYPLKTLARLED